MEEEKRFRACVEALKQGESLSREDWRVLLEGRTDERQEILAGEASLIRDRVYGKRVFIRGLIEFTNFCKNNCYYCGIRRGNQKAERYRLTEEEIMQCCHYGFSIGFRTFVLQGGEDAYFTTERLAAIVRRIKQSFPECAVTLSVGEREREDYRILKEAGADRYLLRHETADEVHYR
ncbi:MAG: radical SAM protein, partial [Lachnospiraceae bacterium]|nr:radical SAM protein [Lachnospiraceae bacterium]